MGNVFKNIIILSSIVLVVSCSTVHGTKSQKEMCVIKKPSVKQLIKNTTMEPIFYGYGSWIYTIPYYNADGHGYFDSFTVFNEICLTVPISTIAVYLLQISETSFWYYISDIRKYPSLYRYSDIKVYDWPAAVITRYIPMCIYTPLGLTSLSVLYAYDTVFHDIPVLISKGIIYPFATKSEMDMSPLNEDITTDTLKGKR